MYTISTKHTVFTLSTIITSVTITTVFTLNTITTQLTFFTLCTMTTIFTITITKHITRLSLHLLQLIKKEIYTLKSFTADFLLYQLSLKRTNDIKSLALRLHSINSLIDANILFISGLICLVITHF